MTLSIKEAGSSIGLNVGVVNSMTWNRSSSKTTAEDSNIVHLINKCFLNLIKYLISLIKFVGFRKLKSSIGSTRLTIIQS